MKLEIKSLKVLKKMSEETLCFTGRLYINNKVFCDVSNHGHGGCNDFNPIGQTGSEMWNKIRDVINPWLAENYPRGEYKDLVPDLDLVVSIIAEETNRLQEIKLQFRRDANSFMVLNGSDVDVYNLEFQNNEKLIDLFVDKLKITRDAVLNLKPRKEALQIYAKSCGLEI